MFKSSIISLTCTFSALENMNMLNFRNQLATFIHAKFHDLINYVRKAIIDYFHIDIIDRMQENA